MGYSFLARMRKDGKITIPEEVRDLLKVDPDNIYEMKIRNWKGLPGGIRWHKELMRARVGE